MTSFTKKNSRSEIFSLSKASLLVVANCIGTGIFTTTGFLLRDLHHPLVVFAVWVLAALYAMLGVRCYQELHRLYPGSGGEYHFLKEGWHAGLGRVAGFVSLVAGFSAPIAAAAVGFAMYAQHFVPIGVNPSLIATVLILLLTGLQLISPNSFFKSHHVFVIGKLLGLTLLVVGSFLLSPWKGSSLLDVDFVPKTMAHSFFWCAYAFSGWNAVCYIASEVLQEDSNKNLRRTSSVHRASFWGTLGVVVLYLSLNAALLFTGDVSLLYGKPEVVATFLEATVGASAAAWLSLFIAFGLISTTTALFITGPRVYARMAQDKALPAIFYTPTGMVPRASLLLQMLVSLMILWFFDFDKILHTTGFVLTLCSGLAVSVLLRKHKPTSMLFWSAFLFCAATVWLVIAGFPR